MRRKNKLLGPAEGGQQVVIVGGGFAGLAAARQLAGSGHRVVLVDRQRYHTFIPMLYQVATQGLPPQTVAVPFVDLFDEQDGIRVHQANAKGIDAAQQVLETDGGPVPYDWLILAHGAESHFYGMDNLKTTPALHSLPDALRMRQELETAWQAAASFSPAERGHPYTVVVVGGGPTGIELAGALADRLLQGAIPGVAAPRQRIRLHLLEGAPRLLPSMSEASGKQAEADLREKGVRVHTKALVKDWTDEVLTLGDGSKLPAQQVLWAAGIRGKALPGLPEASYQNGRYLMDDHLQVAGTERILAAGDVATMRHVHYPGVAQLAIQQGGYAGRHILGSTQGPFSFFNKGIAAIVANGRAVADLPAGVQLTQEAAWALWLGVHAWYLPMLQNKSNALAHWLERAPRKLL